MLTEKTLSEIIHLSMKLICRLLVAVVLLTSAAQAALDISEIGVGARPLGMGKAYFALADDASAIFTNPAGLSLNKNLNVVSMGGSMLGDVNYILFGAAEDQPFGKVGFGYINAAVGTIPLTRLVGSGPSLEAQQYDSTDYYSSLFIISYGAKLSRFLRNGAGGNISLGANLKFLSQGFNGGGTAMQNANGSGMDADFGLLWQTNHWLTLGLTLQNLLPTSLGGKFIWQANPVPEDIPLITHLGSQWNLLGPTALWASSSQRLDLLLDYESSQAANQLAVWHLGLEYDPLDLLALRAGLDQQQSGAGVDNNLTLGVGILFGGFTFDYAYHQFGELSENSTQFFSVGYRGLDAEKEREKRLAEKRKPTIPSPEIVPKPKMVAFPDVPEGYWAKKPIEYLTALGIMDSYDDGTFRPTREITRGELAVLLVKAKGFTVSSDEVKVRFKDVKLQSYEAPYVSLAVERQYIKGFPDKTFKPERRLTRAEAATILARFSGQYLKPKLQKAPYLDVPTSHWAAAAIAAFQIGQSLFFRHVREFRQQQLQDGPAADFRLVRLKTIGSVQIIGHKL